MRKKMYKVGKHWVAAAVAIVGIGMAGGSAVSADEVKGEPASSLMVEAQVDEEVSTQPEGDVDTDQPEVTMPTPTVPVTPSTPTVPVDVEEATPSTPIETLPDSVVPTDPDMPTQPDNPGTPELPEPPSIPDGVNEVYGLYYQDGKILTGISKADKLMY